MSEEFEKLAAILSDFGTATIIEAAEAWKRYGNDPEGLHPKHAAVLFMAIIRSRGAYALALEKAINEYQRSARGKPTAESQDEFLAARQEELRPLWRADLEHIIREAGGKLW